MFEFDRCALTTHQLHSRNNESEDLSRFDLKHTFFRLKNDLKPVFKTRLNETTERGDTEYGVKKIVTDLKLT